MGRGFHWAATDDGWGLVYVGDFPAWAAFGGLVLGVLVALWLSYRLGRLVGAGKARQKMREREPLTPG